MYAHLIQECEKDHVGMVEVIFLHVTIALMRGGKPLVTLFIVFFSHQELFEFHLPGVVQVLQVLVLTF